MVRVGRLFQLLITLLLMAAMPSYANCAELEIIPLETKSTADNVWRKERLVSELNDGIIRITDNEGGDYNDASFWEIHFDQKIPYGRKFLSFDLEVGPRHKPLWGKSVLHPLINGQPAIAASATDGHPVYEAIIAGDGRAYVPLGTLNVRLKLDEKSKALRNFSFVLAGASASDIRMSNFKVHVWPADDPGTTLQGPVSSQLPFLPDEQKLVLYELSAPKEAGASIDLSLLVDGPKGKATASLKLNSRPSVASGSNVGIINFSNLHTSGEYQVTVPPAAGHTKLRSTSFSVSEDIKALERARNDAWGAFYWITDNDNGPYKDTHKRDQHALLFSDKETQKDVRGGWFDAGDYGKYSVNGAYSASLMLLTGLLAPETLDHSISPLANGSDDQPDWLRIVEAELMWLLTMQNSDGGVHHKVATKNFPGMDVTPQTDNEQKWVMPVTSTATADFSAVMSLAAVVYKNLPKDTGKLRALIFEDAAKRAQKWLVEHPNLVMNEQQYDGADYGGPYHDDDDSDERFFANSARATLTREPEVIKKIQALLHERSQKLTKAAPALDWKSVDILALWTLKLSGDALDEPSREMVDSLLHHSATSWSTSKAKTPWRISIEDEAEFPWGSNGVLATTGWHWLLWSRISGNEQFKKDARDQLNWFFGRNPFSKIFVTGGDVRNVKAPHFRPWTSGAIELPAGFLVGGPNSGEASKKAFDHNAPMRMYVDESGSYTTNEVAINWQAAWALYLSLAAAAY